MRIGLVTYWFNRGQGTIGRRLRGILDGLGHETFVLARPTKATFHRPAHVEGGDVWDQTGVTRASRFQIPAEEYVRWADEHALDAVFCFQNYQFDALARLRERGVRTIGAYMWEAFGREHVDGARRACDTVYALTRCEQERYRGFGIDAPFVPWGCDPDLMRFRVSPRDREEVTFFFPGGYLSRRKPLREAVEAFSAVADDRLRLIVKTQGTQQGLPGAPAMVGDRPRVTVVDGDLPIGEHLALMASADVVLAPSRWEGLGLHLYEAAALGLPVITNDVPPMNEPVRHEDNGLLVASVPVEPAPSGIPAYDPEPASLAAAIQRLAEPELRERLAQGAVRASTGRLSWDHTIAGVQALVA